MKSAKLTACLKSFQQLIRLPLMFTNGGFTLSSTLRPWREKVAAGRMRGYQLGFTLIEILMVVLIIGILGAIALPQYQRAVLKSRFAALMPIAKSMADSNEAFYLEHGEYADNAEDLPIQGRMSYPGGTTLEFGTSTEFSYVLAANEETIPHNVYVQYQKHSKNFPDNIHCEALDEDANATWLCREGLHGTPIDTGEIKSLSGEGYTAYLLSGSTAGSTFGRTCTGEAPSETTNCPTGCGSVTVTAQCNTSTGEWEEVPEADLSSCQAKPADQTTACDEGYTGNKTKTATCNEGEWIFPEAWNTGACVSAPMIPARGAVKSGYPQCSTSSGYTSCTYQYEGSNYKLYASERPKDRAWPSCDTQTWECRLSTSSGDGYSSTNYTAGGYDSYGIIYDKNGVFSGASISSNSGGTEFYYDAAGNIIGAYNGYNGRIVKGYGNGTYDANGNVRKLVKSSSNPWVYYYYNEDGTFASSSDGSTPSVTNVSSYKISAEELAQAQAIGASLVGKTKCELYPELQGC